MKKSILPLATLALLASTSSCVNEDEFAVNFEQPTEIRPTASINILSQTRAIEEGPSFSGTDGVFAVTAKYCDKDGNLFTNLPVNKSESLQYSFAGGAQHFPSDGSKLDFYAYSPIVTGADYTGYVATWTLDGTQDILYAASKGIGKTTPDSQKHPNFVFTHKLALFNINIVKGEGFSDDIKVSSLEVRNVKTNASLDLLTGKLTVNEGSSSILPVPTEYAENEFNITDGGLYGQILLPEKESYKLRITTQGAGKNVTYPDIEIKASDIDPLLSRFAAGYKYTVTLAFGGTGITPTVSITPWTDGGSVNKTVQ